MTDPAAGEALGLQLVDVLHQVFTLLLGDQNGRVEPDQPNGSVSGEQLFQLGLDLLAQIAVEVTPGRVREVPVIAGSIRLVPILVLGVVEAQPYAAIPTGLRELFQRVPAERRRVDDVVVARRRVVHRKPLVVLRGDHEVLHAGFLGQPDARGRVELGGIEPRGELLVLGDGYARARHDPRAEAGNVLSLPLAGGNRVEAPVDEHAESGRTPPRKTIVVSLRFRASSAGIPLLIRRRHAPVSLSTKYARAGLSRRAGCSLAASVARRWAAGGLGVIDRDDRCNRVVRARASRGRAVAKGYGRGIATVSVSRPLRRSRISAQPRIETPAGSGEPCRRWCTPAATPVSHPRWSPVDARASRRFRRLSGDASATVRVMRNRWGRAGA